MNKLDLDVVSPVMLTEQLFGLLQGAVSVGVPPRRGHSIQRRLYLGQISRGSVLKWPQWLGFCGKAVRGSLHTIYLFIIYNAPFLKLSNKVTKYKIYPKYTKNKTKYIQRFKIHNLTICIVFL